MSSATLILSQDYELFFGDSGTLEKCLFEPCDVLLDFASRRGIALTFYVDAGMLCRARELSVKVPRLQKLCDRVRAHVESLAEAGHEIGLHVHPHWQDTHYGDDGWDFGNTRYQLRDFSDAEIAEIFDRYTAELNALCDGRVSTYRAGGFCVEPFARIREQLLSNGIDVDSSVVPGAELVDPDKGFDFTAAPADDHWRFSNSPSIRDDAGDFLEVAITPVTLGITHYWRRLFARLSGHRPPGSFGDGRSKAIGRTEVLRRLAGAGRVSELSIDAAKADRLPSLAAGETRAAWHVMGHPKLLGAASLDYLGKFIEQQRIERFESVQSYAAQIRSKAI